ncbi:MAG TPA: heavy-metal-associated domain-containing protein [Anaerolineales bacterium]|nr:heavy-metal-associated domain-containing protein [Anaerolineales bacterium]
MSTMTVNAPAISCGHCVKTIQNEVAELKGVKNVVADQNTKLVTINFDDPATKEQIEALMAEIGYPVEK